MNSGEDYGHLTGHRRLNKMRHDKEIVLYADFQLKTLRWLNIDVNNFVPNLKPALAGNNLPTVIQVYHYAAPLL